jgi:hypothetical protein
MLPLSIPTRNSFSVSAIERGAFEEQASDDTPTDDEYVYVSEEVLKDNFIQ